MKKRVLTLALCLALCLRLAAPALAAGTPEAAYTGQSQSEDVKITINGDIVHTYLVDIEFTTPTFTYATGSVWDPTDYQYKPSAAAEWQGEGSVKIVNHSDLKVDYTVTSENVVATYGPLSIDVTGGEGTIEKCSVGDQIGSHNATATFAVSGTPTVSEILAQKLGEIKVTISK